MADEFGPIPAKRSFWFVFFVGLLTGGIYWIYWFYKTNVEVKEFGKLSISPGMRVAGLILLGWLLLPAIYIYYLWLKDVNETAKRVGVSGPSPGLNAVLSFILPFWVLYAAYRVQATLNNTWDAASSKPQSAAVQNTTQATQAASATPIERVFIKCQRCKTKNPEGNNFCVKCGEKIAD
ncbi:MAG: DUF4234 domain-containing protein [Candidatus Micrarchaeota archaeon]